MAKKSDRVIALVSGLKALWGDDAVAKLLSNPLRAEEIAGEARRHPVAELESALADARAASARTWAWVAERLRRGPAVASSGAVGSSASPQPHSPRPAARP